MDGTVRLPRQHAGVNAADIRRLEPPDAPAYRQVMLHAYAHEPDAFTSTVAERESLPLAWWAARMARGPEAPERVCGAFVDGRLVGVAGLSPERRARTCHRATLFGMYVLPAHRGQGVAHALVAAVLACAREVPGVRVVELTVTESNPGAVRLYASCGFRAFGVEPLAVNVGDRYVSKVHMWIDLTEQPA